MEINENEMQAMFVEVCSSVISTLAEQNKISPAQLNIRIDLESPIATPVFALFNQSAFLSRCDINALIRAGGGAGFEMILRVQISEAIQRIFVSAVKEAGAASTKELFFVLHGQPTAGVLIPYMGIYHNGIKLGSVPLAELAGAA